MIKAWISAALTLVMGLGAAPSGAVTGPYVLPVDIAVSAGVFQITQTWSANAGDYNKDGYQDFLLVRHWRYPAQLWKNNKNGTFSVVATLPMNDPHDCAFGDVNKDGLVDAYCTTGASHGTSVKANVLWMQGPAGTFSNKAVEYAVTDPLGRGRFAVFLDANKDGWLDLFVTNFFPRADGKPTPNRLFINQNGNTFIDASGWGVNNEIGGRCAQAVDYDRDGWTDLFICSEKGLKLYRNLSGTGFADVSAAAKVSGYWRDARMVDMNRDGRVDIVRVNKTNLQVQLQTATGTFPPPTAVQTLVAGWSLSVGDVNRDGRPDVYVVQGGWNAGVLGPAPDLMFVQNGTGTAVGFQAIPVPNPPVGAGEPPTGSGDIAEAIDIDKNGVSEFIVLNGNDYSEGPVQLIQFL